MGREEFLASSPRELDSFTERLDQRRKDSLLGSALVCSVLANVNRDPEKKPEPFLPADFLPWVKQDKAYEDPDAFAEALKKAYGEPGKTKLVKR